MRHTNSLPGRRFRGVALTATVSLSLTACGGVSINSDYDPQASFDTAGRYDWADSTDVMGDNTAGGPFLERRIIRAVDQSLGDRGFVRDTTSEKVDFIVTVFVTEPVPQDFVPVSSGGPAVSVSVGFGHPGYGWGYPWGWHRYPFVGQPGGWGWGWGAPVTTVGFGYTWMPQQGFSSGTSAGTLVVDIFDGESGELIWRGWAERALGEAAYADDMQEFLNQTVAKILRDFPPESEGGSS